MSLDQAPVRLCCGERHWNVVCPDGKVMCCLCFARVGQDELAIEDGEKVDVCQPCAEREATMMEKITASALAPASTEPLTREMFERAFGLDH